MNATQAKQDARPVTVETLAPLSFFAGLTPVQLAQISRYSKRSHFAAGETIFTAGELANRFYVLTAGRVAIQCRVKDRDITVQELGPGDPLSFSWFFTPENLHFSAKAMEPVEAVFSYGTLVREECEIDRSLGYELMRRTGEVMLHRLEALTKRLAESLA